jgi:hypothetical protein
MIAPIREKNYRWRNGQVGTIMAVNNEYRHVNRGITVDADGGMMAVVELLLMMMMAMKTTTTTTTATATTGGKDGPRWRRG